MTDSITLPRATVQQILAALRVAVTPLPKDRQEVLRLDAALQTALEQQQAEPVAWMDREGDLYKMPEIKNWAPPHTMLYTTPPQRKPLTREQRKALIESAINACDEEGLLPDMERFAWMIDAVERAHGIGEKK